MDPPIAQLEGPCSLRLICVRCLQDPDASGTRIVVVFPLFAAAGSEPDKPPMGPGANARAVRLHFRP
jgi:hypothetical protein